MVIYKRIFFFFFFFFCFLFFCFFCLCVFVLFGSDRLNKVGKLSVDWRLDVSFSSKSCFF